MKKKFVMSDFFILTRFYMVFFLIGIKTADDISEQNIFFSENIFTPQWRYPKSPVSPNISISGPLKIETMNGSAQFAPGIIYMYGQIYLGCSDNDIINLQGVNIITDTNRVVCLGVDIHNTIMTTNTSGFQYLLGSHDNASILVDNIVGDITLNTNNVLSGNITMMSNGNINLNANALMIFNGIQKPQMGYTSVLTIDSNGKIGIVLSSKRFKKDIQVLSDDISADFDSLQVVSYKYIDSEKDVLGFIAEDIAKANSKIKKYLVIYDQQGEVLSLDYNGLIALNTQQIINNKMKIKSLASDMYEMENTIRKQEIAIKELKEHILILTALYNNLKQIS